MAFSDRLRDGEAKPAATRVAAARSFKPVERLHLIRGNNDDPASGDADGWASVQDYAEITVDGVLLVLCHYPFRSWNGQHRRSLNLHGHSHGRLKPMPRQFDVGVDARDYRPITLDALVRGRDLSKVGVGIAAVTAAGADILSDPEL